MTQPDTLAAEIRACCNPEASNKDQEVVIEMTLHSGEHRTMVVYHSGEDYLVGNDVALDGDGKKRDCAAHDAPRYISFSAIAGFRAFLFQDGVNVSWGRS